MYYYDNTSITRAEENKSLFGVRAQKRHLHLCSTIFGSSKLHFLCFFLPDNLCFTVSGCAFIGGYIAIVIGC